MSYADQVTVTGNVASGSADSGNPVKTGAVYNSTAPTGSNGARLDSQCDVNGNLKVNVANGITPGTAGSPSTNVLTMQGITGATPVITEPTTGSYVNAIAPATPAVGIIKASAGTLFGVVAFNILATPLYLKMYDVSGSITLGFTAATYEFIIPGNTGGAGFVLPLPVARAHANSIKWAVTNGISLTDNTAITANSCIVDFSYI